MEYVYDLFYTVQLYHASYLRKLSVFIGKTLCFIREKLCIPLN